MPNEFHLSISSFIVSAMFVRNILFLDISRDRGTKKLAKNIERSDPVNGWQIKTIMKVTETIIETIRKDN